MSKLSDLVRDADYSELLLVSALHLYPCFLVGYPLSDSFMPWVVYLSQFGFSMFGVLTVGFAILSLREAILMYKAVHDGDSDF